MKQNLKLFTVLSLVLLLSLTLVGVASADVVQGKGWLHAEGAGVAVLRMSGDIEINGHGIGVVYIYGADEIEATGRGDRHDRPGGGVFFRGYRGTITANGEEMIVKMIGGKIDFTAQGEGTVFLRGRGHYETGHASGDWAADGSTLEVTEEE
jgi:hypothetical protein